MPEFEYAKLQPVSEWIYAGDLIISGNGSLYKVVKVNPKNYVCVDQAGSRWNVRRHSSVRKAPAGTEFAEPVKTPLDSLVIGQVVVFANVTAQRKFGYGKFVVIKSLADDAYQVAALNGDSGRYVRCHRTSLELSSAV